VTDMLERDWNDELIDIEHELDIKFPSTSGQAPSNGAHHEISAPPRFKTLRIADVIDTGPPRFLVEGLWLDKGVGIIGGDPKSWKSFFTVFMAVHIAAGKKLMGRFECKQGKVVIFNAEDTASLTRFRIGCICRALDINIGDLDLHLIDTPALFIDQPDHVELLRNTVREEKPELLILDPLRNLHILDENDSSILPSVLTPIRVIQREFNCAIQVIHHLVKASEGRTMASRLRGTGALRGWYDSGLVLDRQEDGGPVKITVEHRGAEAPVPFGFRLQKSGAIDGGEAIWFEECAVKKRHVSEDGQLDRNDVAENLVISALLNARELCTGRDLRKACKQRAEITVEAIRRLVLSGVVTEEAVNRAGQTVPGYRLSKGGR